LKLVWESPSTPIDSANRQRTLTLYAGAKSPGKDKESNWLPAPNGTFSLYIRAYWSDKAILDGTWLPPKVESMT